MCVTAQDAVEIAELMDEGAWQAKAVVAKQLADAAATQVCVGGGVSIHTHTHTHEHLCVCVRVCVRVRVCVSALTNI
jgi:hypothetical protein